MSSADRSRVLLLGLGPTAEGALAALLPRFDVVGVVRPVAAEDPVSRLAAAAGVQVLSDATLPGVEAAVAGLRPDAVVVSSYDRVLQARVLETCPFVNVHYAPLPRYRGRATVNWAILNGETSTAISVHTLVPGLDAGGLLFQQEVPIGPADTVGDVYDRLDALQRQALADAVARRLAGDEGEPQDESAATYACTRVPDDGEIDWSAPTVAVDRLVRAVGPPFPGAFTYLGLRRLTVLRAEPVRQAPAYDGRVPGRVVLVDRSAGTVDVLTGDGVLRLHELRADDGRTVPAAALVGSVKLTLGLRVPDLVRRLAELERRLSLPAPV
jgi:methionyl-tRNA formyltransferase